MARPKKQGLDYFPLDCDYLSDEKVISVKVNYGAKGIAVLIDLLCAIYRQGYYIEWTDMAKLKVADDLPGVSVDLADKVVEMLVKFGFFDRATYETHRVLTSAGIQRRYFAITRRHRRVGISGHQLPYMLISIERAPAPKATVSTRSRTSCKPEISAAPPATGIATAETWLSEFFADTRRESLLVLCKNLDLGPEGITRLHDLAGAVLSEWQLTGTTHADYSDFSRHLISTIRIKARDSAGKGDIGKGRKPQDPAPEAADYAYDGGFGSIDH